MANDLSIPMLLLSVIQGAGMIVQSIFGMKVLNRDLLSNRLVVALFLVVYNWARMITGIEESLIDAVFFILNCGLLTSSMFTTAHSKVHTFWVLSTLNTLFFALTYLITLYLKGVGIQERYLVLSVVMIMYYLAFGTVNFVIGRHQALKLDHFVTGFVFVMLLFASLVIQEKELVGILTLNMMFIGLVAKELLEHFYFNTSRNIKLAVQKASDKLAEYNLTKTELKVAALILDGNSVVEIAEIFHVTENTIHKHCSNINKKTGVPSTTDFVLRYS